MEKNQQSKDGATTKQAIRIAQKTPPQQTKSTDVVHVNGVAVNRVPVDAPVDHPSIVATPKVRLFASEGKTKESKVTKRVTGVVKLDKKNE